MSFASSLFSHLSSLDIDSTLIDPDGVFRIYPDYVRMSDKAYPQIVFSLGAYKPDEGLDGHATTAEIDVTLLAIGETFDDADELGNALASVLDQTRGTWGSTTVQGCFVEEMSDEHFVDTDMETVLYFQKEITLKVCYVI